MLDANDETRIKELIKTATKEAIAEAIKHTLDLDIEAPDERREVRKDMEFIRSQREFYTTAVRHGTLAAIGLIVVGIAAAIWSAIRVGVSR